jgi:hypothetical protein
MPAHDRLRISRRFVYIGGVLMIVSSLVTSTYFVDALHRQVAAGRVL